MTSLASAFRAAGLRRPPGRPRPRPQSARGLGTSGGHGCEGLARAVLDGDGARFETEAARLRALCRANLSIGAVPRSRPEVLLGEAALAGDAAAFADAEAQLRRMQESFGHSSPSTSTRPSAEPAYRFFAGPEANAAKLRAMEEEYTQLAQSCDCDLTDQRLLRATLELSGAYIEADCLDKAELLLQKAQEVTGQRGGETHSWCTQELAALRVKQNRQPEALELLEGLQPRPKRSLGRVYNSLGRFQEALECFQEASSEDLWQQAVAHKGLGNLAKAEELLSRALDMELHPLMRAQVQESLADCQPALQRYEAACGAFEELVGRNSAFGRCCLGLAQAAKVSHPMRAFEALRAALEVSSQVQAKMDALHPSALYELLDQVEDLLLDDGSGEAAVEPRNFLSLVEPLLGALERLKAAQNDRGGDGGVVLQKAAQVLLYAADFGAPEQVRPKALQLLRRAKQQMEAADASVELSELLAVADLQIKLAEARLTSA
ncbi:unnamed protein product [Effrenium voratum]|uniref:Uncharacterized protein n=1 Tax=Effrenium voratum TaxID=2562239 RepID=A0AA36JKD2_9DINO|nr:unnamed protein product [Effrenium voratum]